MVIASITPIGFNIYKGSFIFIKLKLSGSTVKVTL